MPSLTGVEGAWIDVQVMGAPLNPMIAGQLVAAEVDLSMFVPSQFRLVFRGSRDEVLIPSGLQLATKVNLQVSVDGVPTPLMTMADVTAVEVDYGPEGDLTIVKGMDGSHRLMRGSNAMAYPDMTASDVVAMLVAEVGLIPKVESTSTTYEWLTQANVSAWVFIQQLAALENYVAYVDSLGMFNFCSAKKPMEAPPPVMDYAQPAVLATQLTLGDNLLRLRGTIGAAEQVPAVTVLGNNPKENVPVVGLGPNIPSTALSLDPAASVPAVVAGEFEAKPFFDSSIPFDDEGAAQNRAMAVAADIAGSLAQFEGESVGNPGIAAGEIISLGMVGLPFDGQYLVTAARHVFEGELGRYTTWFTVGGRRDRSMYSLASGSAPMADTRRPNVPGVVTGTVMNNMDPESQGRVQVMFPWLGATYMSPWARTVQLGAGPVGGCLFVPEVGEEVLVAFDRGDMNYPYVIGNLYNGMFKPVPGPELEGPLVASRRITTRGLHQILFDDGPSKMGITISTGLHTCEIKMDDTEQQMTITCLGKVGITAVQGVEFDTPADFKVTAGGQFTVTAASGFTVESGGSAGITGAAGVSIEGSNVSVSAPSISLGA